MEQQQLENLISESRGMVANIHSAFMPYPNGVLAHYRFYSRVVLNEGPLPRVVREFIAMEVSRANRCDYCFYHHSSAYDQRITLEIPAEELSYFKEFAEVVSKNPHRVSKLKASFPYNVEGTWEHAIMIASYFNMANRMAAAMELEIEDNFQISCH